MIGRGNGTLRDITLSGCPSKQCEVKLDKNYNGNISLTLGNFNIYVRICNLFMTNEFHRITKESKLDCIRGCLR